MIIKVVWDDRLYESLTEDGYSVEGKSDDALRILSSRQATKAWLQQQQQYNPFSLKMLCHQVIYHNRHRLAFYTDVLPTILATSIKEFLMIRDTIEYYDKYM